ncbi:MAG: flagellar hook protein FlgE [bacterium]
MMRSLFAGVSGMNSQQLKMDVIGNNIANVNTIGFKSSRIQFHESFGQLLGSAQNSLAGGSVNPIQVGLGTRTGSVDRQFSQGTLLSTNSQTDLGLQGKGFFVVGDGQREYYTRAGNFHFDHQGRFVTPSGFFVRGLMADADGNIPESSGSLENIDIDPTMISPAVATKNISLTGNLAASAKITQETWTANKTFTVAATGAPAIGTTQFNDLVETTTPLVDGDTITITGKNPDGTDVSATFTYGAGNDGATLDDLLGVINNAYTGATATLENGVIVVRDDNFGDSKLEISVKAGSSNAGTIALPTLENSIAGTTPKVTTSALVYDSLGLTHVLTFTFTKTENEREWAFKVSLDGDETITQGGSGTLVFGADGTLDTGLNDAAEVNLTFDPKNSAEAVTVGIDFGKRDDLSGMTLFDGKSTVNVSKQDGQGLGNLSSFFIDEAGRLFGTFTNGVDSLIAQVGLSQFSNPEGLVHVANNVFQATESSGKAIIGKAGNEFDTAILSGTLESSNVDLAQEFTEMIIAQRAFQANARTITVADQFLNEVVQLKR